MIGLLEWAIIVLPLLVLVLLSLIMALLIMKFKAKTGEESLLHLTAIFLFAGFLFLCIAIGVIISDQSIQYSLFALANFSFWFLLMELGVFYLTTFVNPNVHLPSARLYIPAIQGAAVCISSLKVLEANYSVNGWELMIYTVSLLTELLLQSILIKELVARKKFLHTKDQIIFIDSIQKIMLIGTVSILYNFSSVIIWFFVRTNNLYTHFSLLVVNFQPIDWLVYFNLPLLLVCFISLVFYITRINGIISKVDIEEIYNTLGL